MHPNKIVPCIWFHTGGGVLSPVLDYYNHIFSKDFQSGHVVPLGETPSGNAEMCEVILFGQKFVFMGTAQEHHTLNDAVPWMIYCKDQDEIDAYWNYFTTEGKASQCGWCIDKYGLRWQVLPHNLSELMQRPNAFQVMMGQTKIVIEDYLK